MKLPGRPPRNEPNLEPYNYYDHEDVVQDDGQIAYFQFQSKQREKGWRFMGYKDKYKFNLWTDADRKRMWDNKITYEQVLLESAFPPTWERVREELGPNFKVADDELLYGYEYGSILSMRAGWFVVSKSNPVCILRSIGTRMS